MGTIAIEGGEVVVRLQGRRRERRFGPLVPWSNEYRVPLAQARLTVTGNEVVVRRGTDAVQSVRCDDPDEVEAFVRALEAAQHTLATPKAACSHCGAPGQAVGLPCAFCGVAVAVAG